ncbi:MAG: hypothetical protein WAU77_05630 [Solirubrobacteraceae bacterium]
MTQQSQPSEPPRKLSDQPRLVEVQSSETSAEPMKCVWSGHPHYDRDCRARIPASVVVKAWHREMGRNGAVEGFFNFTWRHGVWLAYGLSDGGVRGVYCPTHCSERDSREVLVEDRRADQPAGPALQ